MIHCHDCLLYTLRMQDWLSRVEILKKVVDAAIDELRGEQARSARESMRDVAEALQMIEWNSYLGRALL